MELGNGNALQLGLCVASGAIGALRVVNRIFDNEPVIDTGMGILALPNLITPARIIDSGFDITDDDLMRLRRSCPELYPLHTCADDDELLRIWRACPGQHGVHHAETATLTAPESTPDVPEATPEDWGTERKPLPPDLLVKQLTHAPAAPPRHSLAVTLARPCY